MLAHTHGQPASPTTLGKEIANVVGAPAAARRRDRRACKLLGKINGAVGNYNAHMAAYPEIDWEKFARTFRRRPRSRVQSVHHPDRAARCTSRNCSTRIARANTILIDLDRDIWGYVSLGYFTQKTQSRRGRLVDDAAQGQPDRFREFGRQSRHRQRAAAPHEREAAGVALAARSHRLDRAAQHGRGVRLYAARRTIRCLQRSGASSKPTSSVCRPISTRTGRCWPSRCRP